MKLRKIISLLIATVLILSTLTSCARTPEEMAKRADETLEKKAYSIEIEIDYHTVDSEVAGLFDQLERSETTLYFKGDAFKAVNDLTIDDGDGDINFHSVYTVFDGTLYSNLVYTVDGVPNPIKSKAEIGSDDLATFISSQRIIGNVSAEDFKNATLEKKDGNVYLVCSDVSEELYIALEKALVAQLEASSDSVKATQIKMSAELDGKRYDTITVDSNFTVNLNGKSYFVGMKVELEFDYDDHFDVSAPLDASEYSTVSLDVLI